jgi:acetylornithine aminotransferase
MKNAEEVGNYLINELNKIPQISEVRGRGLMIGIELSETYSNVKKDLLFKHRIFTGEAKPNVIRLLPALNISNVHADQFLTALKTELNK